jgi:hypothetical protein
MLVQFYNDDRLVRGYKDRNSEKVFEAEKVDWRKLRALGLPPIGKSGKATGWNKTSWGWEIEVEFTAKVVK